MHYTVYRHSFLLLLINFFVAGDTTTVDYSLYETPSRGSKHGQFNLVKQESVHGGMNAINDEVNRYMHQKHNALTVIVHNN